MSQITTHILDTTLGKPAVAVTVTLAQQVDGEWVELAAAATDENGRVAALLADRNTALPAGQYKLSFNTGDYYQSRNRNCNHNTPCFYPRVEIIFSIRGDGQHYHIPLLLNPFGYSTYRGS